MAKDERRQQLLDVAFTMIGEEGTDALTLARVAERAGVSKPIAYTHFGTRAGLLSALYRDYDDRQTEAMRAAIKTRAKTLADAVAIVAETYVDCTVSAGPEVSAIAAALSGSEELEEVLQACRQNFMDECRQAFTPFVDLAGAAGRATLIALIGVADALSAAAAARRVSRAVATETLCRAMNSLLSHHKKLKSG
ncbi:MAG TPA: TetR/AcrR family transcriptional regulator [Vineibacter sp.]|nr:TetR/AcrR family transcriptional regulator [Vineibacter sp.]